MLNFLPTKIDEQNIAVTVVNSMQVDALTNHKKQIETYLSKVLSNNIRVTIGIDDSIVKTQVFTPEEKLRKMQESNAAFNRLKNALSLEIV